MLAERPLAQVIDLEEARALRLPPAPRFGGAHVKGDRVVVHAIAAMTPAAAEAFARTLCLLAEQAREATGG